MNNLRTLTAAVLMVFLVASSAAAAGPDPGDTKGDWKYTVELMKTRFAQKDTFGYCTIKSEGGVEMLGVRVFGDMPDDKLLIVQIVNDKGVFEVGTMRMFLGSASLVLYSTSLVPSPAFPLTNVRSVIVRDVENPLLSYTWKAAGISLPTR
jgi:hypothetical protein